MRLRLMLVSILGLFLAPLGAIRAQTAEIHYEVETKLWFLRVLQRIEDAGFPPLVLLLVLIALILAVVAAVWLWRSRRKPVS
jgi:ABC-type uncharacterized transport system permease subunit